MTRIGTLGANTAYVDRILDIQSRINDTQIQVSTGLKSESYAGIATDANTLLNFETEKASAEQFIKGNTSIGTKLSAAAKTVDGIQTSLKNFNKNLTTFFGGNTTDQKNVEQIQTFAFQTMIDIQSYLSANVNGQYLFSGGRLSTEPVVLPASTLTGFQALYDGDNKTWPTSRAAQLLETTIPRQETTKLTFTPATGTIRAADANALTPLATGSVVSVTNSVSNNTDYQVRSHAAMNVGGTALAEGTTASATTVSYGSTPTNLTSGANTGALTFAFMPNGNMKITPATANSLSNLTAGTTFTINGSTSWDGAYKVITNLNGAVELAIDTDQAKSETIGQTAAAVPLSIKLAGVAQALTFPGTATITATPSAASDKTLVTITGGAGDFSGFAAIGGEVLTIGGSSSHNGTFTTVSATANSVTFAINSDALRVSKFLPQTGRTDVTVSFDAPVGTPPASLVTSAAYTSLSFSPIGTTGERITATGGATSFQDALGNPYPAVGKVITLTSTSGVNDGVYKVTANNGSNIEVESVQMTAEAGVTTADLATTSWYKGDSLQIQHRIDQDRQVNVGVYASDTAFEKAFRALGLIAQGTFGTSGGLDSNQSRITQAMYLLNDSLQSPAAGTPPFGTELRGDITTVQQNLGFVQQVINNKNDKHKNFIGFLGARIATIEQIDKNEAVTGLLSDSNALQASYQALAKVQGLSLMNYLK
ncbi:MAG: flagellin [Phaeospirillum sp.]|nr:flagellin [Phaeospirillum sp.]